MKERIIGAVVLVALVVLVVPVFLDGPPSGGKVQSERVPLPGQDEQETQTVVLERNRSEPVPAQSAARSAPPAATQTGESRDASPDDARPAAAARTEAEPAPPADDAADAGPGSTASSEPPAADEPAPRVSEPPPASAQPASATGMFAVQLGSFSSKENAERLAAELRKQGFAAFLSQLDASRGPLHRVRVGPQKDRQAAEAMARRLAQAGHKGQVVPHP